MIRSASRKRGATRRPHISEPGTLKIVQLSKQYASSQDERARAGDDERREETGVAIELCLFLSSFSAVCDGFLLAVVRFGEGVARK